VTGDGGGARRWREIEQLRSEAGIEVPVRHFLADLQTRFLIGEFIRARHHLRAADVITQHGDHLGGVSFNDPALQQTIADVCVAHGLRQHELEDRTKYPDRRDIRGEQVNVRLLAILLRLGDLLDMNSDRACPLLLNAACPLPADSLAHWTQYQRISHKMVAPDRIELRAECQNQEEHMFLQDWCQWELHPSVETKFP
jgi:molecular chaperone HtpG